MSNQTLAVVKLCFEKMDEVHKIKKDLLSSKNFHKVEEKMLGFQPKIGALTLNKEHPLRIREM